VGAFKENSAHASPRRAAAVAMGPSPHPEEDVADPPEPAQGATEEVVAEPVEVEEAVPATDVGEGV